MSAIYTIRINQVHQTTKPMELKPYLDGNKSLSTLTHDEIDDLLRGITALRGKADATLWEVCNYLQSTKAWRNWKGVQYNREEWIGKCMNMTRKTFDNYIIRYKTRNRIVHMDIDDPYPPEHGSILMVVADLEDNDLEAVWNEVTHVYNNDGINIDIDTVSTIRNSVLAPKKPGTDPGDVAPAPKEEPKDFSTDEIRARPNNGVPGWGAQPIIGKPAPSAPAPQHVKSKAFDPAHIEEENTITQPQEEVVEEQYEEIDDYDLFLEKLKSNTNNEGKVMINNLFGICTQAYRFTYEQVVIYIMKAIEDDVIAYRDGSFQAVKSLIT